MLSTHFREDRFKGTGNLVPKPGEGMRSRPAAQQIVDGKIAAAGAWENKLLLEKQGRLVLWTGNDEIDIAPAGFGLDVAAFQALTQNAERENRLYVADGVNPLWYIAHNGTTFEKQHIDNSVTDTNGQPYALPVAKAVATWRNRLWTTDGGNRAQHCENDAPEAWDPLYVVECQSQEADRMVSLTAHGNKLIPGMTKSLWAITGDSHLNWQRAEYKNRGTAGPHAAVSDNENLYWISKTGIHSEAVPNLEADIVELFAKGVYPGSIAIDRVRSLLLCLFNGRLLVMHLSRPGYWGEITDVSAVGLIQTDDHTGWYGDDGAWILTSYDLPDQPLSGDPIDFVSQFDTWGITPNHSGDGRARLPRARFLINGSARGNATYRVSNEAGTAFQTTLTLTDETITAWDAELDALTGESGPTDPVAREASPQLAGKTFYHRLSAPCYMEVLRFDAAYKFGEKQK